MIDKFKVDFNRIRLRSHFHSKFYASVISTDERRVGACDVSAKVKLCLDKHVAFDRKVASKK